MCINAILTWSLLILYYNCIVPFRSPVHNTQVNFLHHYHPRICTLKIFFFSTTTFECSFTQIKKKKHHLEIWQWVGQRIFGISGTNMQNSQYIFITHDRDAKFVWFICVTPSHQTYAGHTQLSAMATLKRILACTNLHYIFFLIPLLSASCYNPCNKESNWS